MPAGAIVLVQRGTCPFLTKWANAEAAGAGAIVQINEGNPDGPDDRVTPLWFDLDGSGVTVPMVAAQIATVEDLVGSKRQGLIGKTVRLRVEWRTATTPTENVIAETRGGDPNKVIVVGAHLDSVGTGPGINDHGSGSAANLEIARQLRGVSPKNKIRFIWFSAEESGLLGSEAYVASLSESERGKIAAMLNFDMIGSPNFVRFVYDGDLSDSPEPPGGAPAASAQIEDLFLDYFAAQGLATEPTAFDGRSDYGRCHW
jgi:Zn-dependent M28 family amino/carboxypeptidase